MADILKNIKGRFMLSINDTPFIRETFKSFKIGEVKTRYTIEKNNDKVVTELIIAN